MVKRIQGEAEERIPKKRKKPREERKNYRIEDPVTTKIEHEYLTQKEANALRKTGLLVTGD